MTAAFFACHRHKTPCLGKKIPGKALRLPVFIYCYLATLFRGFPEFHRLDD